MRNVFICSIAWSLLPTFAHAQSATDAVQNFGLLGTWAAECSQSPSPRNEHAVFSLTTFGTVQVRNDFGRDYDEMVYHVVNARRIAAERLALRQVLATDMHVVLDVVMLKVEDKVRVWSSRGADGTALVRDGAIAAGGGAQTRWTMRCQGRWAEDFFGPQHGDTSSKQQRERHGSQQEQLP